MAVVQSFEKSQSRGLQGAFFEKYNALDLGGKGFGGEYLNQTGFGWTNGCIIEFVSRYGDLIY